MNLQNLARVLSEQHSITLSEPQLDIIITELSAQLIAPGHPTPGEPAAPSLEQLSGSGVSLWQYGWAGGRSFKVCEDEDGFYTVLEQIKPGIWATRSGDDYQSLGETLSSLAFWEN